MSDICAAFLALLTPTCIIWMLCGTFMGIIIGALPGLGAMLAVPILLPITFGMEPILGLAILISVWIGSVSGGFISAVLLGIPGTTSSIATCFDGYPMSKKGDTTHALGTGIVASFIGTFFSTLIAMFASVAVAHFALEMGPWELGSLCICAITMVIGLSSKNIPRGLAGAFLGLLLGSIGSAPIEGTRRFTFNIINLSGGINLTAMMMGLFAVRIIVVDHSKGLVSYKVSDTKISGFGVTFKELFENLKVILYSFFVGLWIGFLPGMGSGLSNLVAYSGSKKFAKHPENYGNGEPAGVWASETSNNAALGGALIPMTAMGIPGDSMGALLLGALMIHGLEPGPFLFQKNPVFAYSLFVAVLISAVFVLFMEFFGMRLFPKILKIPYNYLYTAVMVLSFVGAYAATHTAFNMGEMVFFGAIGVILVIGDIPLTPLMLAYILGPMIEKYVRRGYSYGRNSWASFVTRPVSAIFLLIAVLSICTPLIKKLIAGIKEKKDKAQK